MLSGVCWAREKIFCLDWCFLTMWTTSMRIWDLTEMISTENCWEENSWRRCVQGHRRLPGVFLSSRRFPAGSLNLALAPPFILRSNRVFARPRPLQGRRGQLYSAQFRHKVSEPLGELYLFLTSEENFQSTVQKVFFWIVLLIWAVKNLRTRAMKVCSKAHF